MMQIPMTKNERNKLDHTLDWPVEKTKTPGLVVHKEIGYIDGQPVPCKKFYGTGYYWTITHESSGWLVLGMLHSGKEAHRIAGELGVLDWTLSSAEIMKRKKAYGKVVNKYKVKLEGEE